MIKNFLFVLRRFRTSSVINIIGLTVAFASFLIIVMQVHFEYGFEGCHPNADRIYRLELKRRDGNTAILSRPLTREVIRSSPHVLHGTLINPYLDRFYFTVDKGNGQAEGFRETFVTCNTDIVQIFGFRMVEGSADCLKQPENVIVPKSMALRMFGGEPAVGKQITLTGNMWTKQDRGFLVVGGVYEDFPANTQLNNHIYTAISENDNTVNDWTSGNYLCYLLLDGNAAPEEVMENFNANFDFSILRDGDKSENISIHLRPLRSIYFYGGDTAGQTVKSGSPAIPLILLTVGLLIVAIALINYVNFAMALAPRRIRSINTHRILGSTKAALRANIIAESVIMSLLSFVLALVSVCLIYSSRPALFSQADIHPLHNLPALAITGIVALVTGFAAGIRPAIYLTSIPPAMAIKGSFGLSPSGKGMRTALMGFQFFVSTLLVFCAFFLYRQNRFMQQYTLGYDTGQIALVELPQSIAVSRNTFVAALKDHPGIEDVAFSQQKFGAGDSYRTWTGKYRDENIRFCSLPVSWNFPALMGIKAIDGRLPDEGDVHEDCILYAVNRTLQEKYGMTPGELIDVLWMKKSDNPGNGRILGVVDDLKFTSLRKQVDNMVFVFNDRYATLQSWSYIRIGAGADMHGAVEHIRKTIAGFDAAFPVSVEFYDGVFDALYHRELNTGAIISLFGLIALIIAVAGVFGMVMFECEYRRREIGIRKVLGSTGYEILLLFNRSYLSIFAAGFALAVPTGYYALSRWLDNFAYRTALPWWGFALAGLPVLAIIVLTVCIQCYKAAIQNPVKAIK